MILRILATSGNVYVIFQGFRFFGLVGLLPMSGFRARSFLVFFIWPILNIMAIWWGTQSRARWRGIILRNIVTIVNGLVIVCSLISVFGLSPPSRDSTTWTFGIFPFIILPVRSFLVFFIWPILNIMAIWWGCWKLKRKRVSNTSYGFLRSLGSKHVSEVKGDKCRICDKKIAESERAYIEDGELLCIECEQKRKSESE